MSNVQLPERLGTTRGQRPNGFSLTELLVALALMAALAAMAIPPLAGRLRTERVHSAALALRSLLQQARAAAGAQAANVAVVFDPPATGQGGGPGDGRGGEDDDAEGGGAPRIGIYLDANHNGVRRAEIAAGEERVLQEPFRFGDRFPGVTWGAPADLTGGEAIPGHQVGVAGMISFSPLGGSGSGRITVSGEGTIYSVVIHGGSSRIRLERRAGDSWIPA